MISDLGTGSNSKAEVVQPVADTTSTDSGQILLQTDNAHLDSFEEFFQHLNLAANAALPISPPRYSSVHVLLLRWEDDDLGTEREVADLEKVFRDSYHYYTERYEIPTDDPTTQLEYKLNDFRRAYDDGNSLLVLYYGGHGALERRYNGPSRSIWAAMEDGGPQLVWSDLQGVLERAKSDVVFILDCCYAATAARNAGSKEGFWACNSDVQTTGVNDNSFTRNLIEELTDLNNTRFNIAMLHARLMRRYRKSGSHMLLTEPWYTYLGNAVSSSAELKMQPWNRTSIPQAESTSLGSTESQEATSSATSVTSLTIDEAINETMVLLVVRLQDSSKIPDLDIWNRWCHKLAPEGINSVHAFGRLKVRDLIKLEGLFHSHSSLILVSVSIYI